MRIRDPDPLSAATMVNLWAETAYQKLEEAHEHALKAYQIERQLEGWLICLPGYVTPTPPPFSQQSGVVLAWNERCEHDTPAEMEGIIATLSEALILERSQSLGLLPVLEIAFSERATVPEYPARYQTGAVMVAGAIIGFLIAVWLTCFSTVQHNV
jgi:hypothetical protein